MVHWVSTLEKIKNIECDPQKFKHNILLVLMINSSVLLILLSLPIILEINKYMSIPGKYAEFVKLIFINTDTYNPFVSIFCYFL